MRLPPFIAKWAKGLRETSGPANLAMGAVADGEPLRRSGSTIIGAPLGPVEKTRNELVTLLGLAHGNYSWTGWDFEGAIPPGWNFNGAGAGQTTLSATADAIGGVGRMDTPAAGTNRQCNSAVMTRGSATKKWAFKFRFRHVLPASPTANTRAGMGIFDLVGASIMVGVYGGLSTTQFVLQYDGLRGGTKADLGAVDLNWHTALAWHNGDGLYRCTFDATTITPVTPAAPIVDIAAWHDTWAAGVAEQVTMDRDWFVAVFER